MRSSRKRIPAALRARVWNTYIGEERGTFQCMCGGHVSQLNFECGHVIPFADGGKSTVENLRPLCTMCNRSMGAEHMFSYMAKIGANPNALYRGDAVYVPNRTLAPPLKYQNWNWLLSMGRGVMWTLQTSWWLVGKLAKFSKR